MKASLTLSNGVVVTLQGGAEEVRATLRQFDYGRLEATGDPAARGPRDPGSSTGRTGGTTINLAAVVRAVKDSDEGDAIEGQILDRPRQLERVLLPLYALHGLSAEAGGLTSGEISRVCAELGVPLSQPNVSGVLAKAGARFVIGDRTRVKGQAVRYRLSRRGVQYIQGILREE